MAKEGRDSNRVAALLICDEHDNILMGRRNDDFKWSNPGGHLKVNEDAYEGAIRELKEETGLDVQEIQLIKMTKCGKNLVYLFEVRVDPDQIIDPSNDPDKESDWWIYVDPNDVREELHIPLEHNVVLKYWIDN